jgi:hypothetical protein
MNLATLKHEFAARAGHATAVLREGWAEARSALGEEPEMELALGEWAVYSLMSLMIISGPAGSP